MGPVFVCSGDDIWLVRGDKREKRNTIAPQYTVLKTIDHIPLGLFVLLDKRVGQPLLGDPISVLERTMLLSNRAEQAVEELDLPPLTKSRLASMLKTTRDFEQKVHDDGKVSRHDLDAFIESIRPATMANVDDAVAMELSSLDAAVQDFRRQMTPEEWKRLHVVVASGHMPRDHERRMQYFELLLDQHEEGDRVIYQEGSDDIDKAIDLAATHILDASIAREYFKGDSWRMHRDLLSDSAAKYLREHPPTR